MGISVLGEGSTVAFDMKLEPLLKNPYVNLSSTDQTTLRRWLMESEERYEKFFNDILCVVIAECLKNRYAMNIPFYQIQVTSKLSEKKDLLAIKINTPGWTIPVHLETILKEDLNYE